MYSVKNNLNQPQTVGEQTLPVDGQIEVESVDKRTRGLAERGFLSITKIESESAAPPISSQSPKTEQTATLNKERK